jgi:murein DD-endopeptidase MepM/ murein hydrolase activator NlpD
MMNSTDNSVSVPLRARDVALAIGIAIVAALALIATLSALALLAPPAKAADPSVRLTRESAAPSTAFFQARRRATFRFEIGGRRSRDLRIQAVRSSDREVFRGWRRSDVRPGRIETVRWNGAQRSGAPAPGGEYFFRVRVRGGGEVERRRASGTRRFEMRPHKFPVRGRHRYGDGFGAGRGHDGQDVFADCGTPMVAARAGRVQDRGSHSSAGNYVVIDGRRTRRDYVYMHLRRRATVGQGDRVRTGQRIGAVGASGNASGCHLHFEIWSAPGWYEGGRATRSVTRALKSWDRWS